MSPMPDFFIVGAPKCGTSALHAYLSAHPGVFTPAIKEPHFFCADMPGLARVPDLAAYEALFARGARACLRGEASATYLFSEVAVREIMARYPHARIIVMLREPAAAARSYHRQLLSGLIEDIEDFETAWNAQADRAAGLRIPPGCPEPALLQYEATYRYLPQLRRLFDLVPPAQRHVVIYETFFADPAKGYAEVVDFLGLPPDGRGAFPSVNAGRTLRSRALARFYLSPPRALRRLWDPIRPLAHALGVRPPEILQALNSSRAAPPPLAAGFKAELAARFAGDAAELEALLGHPLPEWRRGA